MIPHIIHYCWFGRKPLDEKAINCIESWRKHLPDWEIKEWNEDNFDINIYAYVQEAYIEKKWAFVSDVARLVILEQNGGVYLDTDVELISNIDDLLENGAFLGIESLDKGILVNPGLIMASEPHNEVISTILKSYTGEHFKKKSGDSSKYTIVERTTNILVSEYGLKNKNEIQKLGCMIIYPKDYFCPMDYNTGELHITNETKSIHWFTSSWLTDRQKKRQDKWRKINRIFPDCIANPVGTIYIKMGAAFDIIRNQGITGLLKRLHLIK